MSSRRLSWVVVASAGLGFVVLAWWLIPWDWFPSGRLVTVAPRDVFTADQLRRSDHFSGLQRQWGLLALGVSLIATGVLGFTRVGSRLVNKLPGPWWVKVPLGAFAFLVIGNAATLPMAWRAQQLDLDYGLSHQRWAGWWQDQTLSLLVAWVATSIALVVVIGLARKLPRTWPVWAAAGAAALAVAGSFVYPVLVEPLFNNFTSMSPGPLRSDILTLAKKEQVPVRDVLVADASRRTTTLNAYVSGFGSTRRIVVYDNLLNDLPRAQIEVVVAHELAHAKHHDVLIGTILGAAGSALGIGVLGLLLANPRLLRRAGARTAGDPGVVALVLVLAALGSLAASPVESTISRAVEAHADLTALEVTKEPEAFVQLQRQLALRSLADPAPPGWSQWFFGSHPTTMQRIGMARAVEAQGHAKPAAD